jgi:Uma2 family endonuclease
MTDSVQETIISPSSRSEGVSLEEWYRLWSIHHAVEVVNGEVIAVMPPEIDHVVLMKLLFRSLDNFVVEHKLGEVFPDGAAYILDGNVRKKWVKGSRVPDLSFVTRQRLDAYLVNHELKGPLYLAPDLAVEIVSKNDSFSDVVKKAQEYLRYGVRMVWVIDPDGRIIYVYTLENTGGTILNEGDRLSADPLIPGWSASVQSILDGKVS